MLETSNWISCISRMEIDSRYCGCRSPGIPGTGTGPLLFVSRHTWRHYWELRANNWPHPRVTIYCADSGVCIKEISCSLFKRANTMALA